MTNPNTPPENLPGTAAPEGERTGATGAPGEPGWPGAPERRPGTTSRPPSGGAGGPAKTPLRNLPENIRLYVGLWLAILALEITHQLLNMVIGLMDTSTLRANARQMMSQEQLEQVGEANLETVAIASVIILGLLSLAMMGLLLWMVVLFKNRSRHAPIARRLLLVFGFYFAFRILMIFILTPGGSDIPVAMYAVDGSLQIIAGVAAVLTLVLGFRSDILKWTGETPGEITGSGGGNDRGSGGRGRGTPPAGRGDGEPPRDQEK